MVGHLMGLQEIKECAVYPYDVYTEDIGWACREGRFRGGFPSKRNHVKLAVGRIRQEPRNSNPGNPGNG